MEEIVDFLNSEDTFKKVYQKLLSYDNEISTTKGFISGGSVSNIIISMLHGGEPVINDIDIYVEDGKKLEVNDWYPTTYINEEGLEMINDTYGRVYINEDGSRMKVTGHSRKGINNIIKYVYENYRKIGKSVPTEKNLVILQGFDLNCCKSGLDLENKRIVYTLDFVDYLKTKQLKVVNPCAPIQTAIRLHKKMMDLNCYCDIEHEMRYLTVASKKINSGQLSKYIGPETYDKFEKYKDFVGKYFTLREPKNSSEIPESLKDKYYIGNKLNPGIKIWVFDCVKDFDIAEHVDSVNRLKRIWWLLYTFKKGSEQDRINKIFYKNFYLNKNEEDYWYRNDYNSKPDADGNYVKIPYYDSNRYTYHMILTKKDYHKCDFDLKHVDYIDNFTKEHGGIRMFLRNCNTLIEQYNLIRFIKSLVNKEGYWVIGALENSHTFLTTTRDENNRLLANIIGKDVIIKLIEKYKKENSNKLVEPINLSNFEYKDCVQELTTNLELKSEGQKMGHCVGGYSRPIMEGQSRIFHIDCDGIGSTVEIGLPLETYNKGYRTPSKNISEVYQPTNAKDGECIIILEDLETIKSKINEIVYRVKQHYGRYPEKGNLKPTDINKSIVNELVRYLNINHLPSNFRINYESFANKEENGIFV